MLESRRSGQQTHDVLEIDIVASTLRVSEYTSCLLVARRASTMIRPRSPRPPATATTTISNYLASPPLIICRLSNRQKIEIPLYDGKQRIDVSVSFDDDVVSWIRLCWSPVFQMLYWQMTIVPTITEQPHQTHCLAQRPTWDLRDPFPSCLLSDRGR